MPRCFRNCLIIAHKEISTNCLKKQFIVFSIFFFALTIFINVNVYKSLIGKLLAVTPSIAEQSAETLLCRTSVFSAMVLVASMFQIFIKERIERTVETLICYPVLLDSIWIGRVIAIWSVYTLGCYTFGATLYLSVCLITGKIIFVPIGTIFTITIAAPLMGAGIFITSGLFFWLTQFGKIGSAIFFLIAFLAYFRGGRFGEISNPWFIFWSYIAIGALGLFVGMILRWLLLTRERIILQ